MTVRIVHTADNHIGLKFAGRPYPPELRQRLVHERFAALERVVRVANERDAHFLVVAGDLFDSLHVGRADIRRTAEILSLFGGAAVVVLPGNHDFYEGGKEALWQMFRASMSEHLLVLLDRPEAVHLSVDDQDVIFYPAPCTAKHAAAHVIGWVQAAPKPPGAVTIGVAHGSVAGISPDLTDRYYPMTEADLMAGGVDLWLLGHTHVRFPDTPRPSLFYIPATHTPDGFDCGHDGFVWYLELEGRRVASCASITTGALRFHDWDRDVRSAADLERCRQELEALDPEHSLVKVSFRGRLSEEERSQLTAITEAVAQRFLYTEFDVRQVALNVTREQIDRTYSPQSLPHRLLTALARDPADDLALQLAHALVEEARQ